MYWKKAVESFPKEENLAFWLQNGFYYLENEDKNILLTKDAWFNNRIMDAGQNLIFKVLGKTDSFQSVLNPQKRSSYSFRAVNNDFIQLLHDVKNHWLLSFLFQWPRSDMWWPENHAGRFTPRSLNALYRNLKDTSIGKLPLSILPVQKQAIAIVHAVEILDGKSSFDARFDVPAMRIHLISCLMERDLRPFPKVKQDNA